MTTELTAMTLLLPIENRHMRGEMARLSASQASREFIMSRIVSPLVAFS